MTRLTNPQYAERAGCDYTTASKIRNGQRLPGLWLFAKTMVEFDLDANEAVRAYLKGRQAFAAFLNRTVFDPPEPKKSRAKSTKNVANIETSSEVPPVVFKS